MTHGIKKFFCLLLTFLLIAACMSAASADGVSALFINVGKADAALLFLGEERYLIDTGTKDSYDQLIRVLETYGVEHLSGVIITHTDKDHAGGLKKLLKGGMKVDRLYGSLLHSEPELDEHRVWEAADKYSVPLTWLKAGDVLTAKDGSAFHVLGPLKQDSENENNNSLVLRLVTAEGDMLLTGDMELEEEADLIERGLITKAPVLKVAHHGEDDSTSKKFAFLVQPQWAVISTNTVEEPDTPDSKILSRLTEARASVAVTQDAEVGILVTLEDGKAEAHAINWQ